MYMINVGLFHKQQYIFFNYNYIIKVLIKLMDKHLFVKVRFLNKIRVLNLKRKYCFENSLHTNNVGFIMTCVRLCCWFQILIGTFGFIFYIN